MSMHQKEAALPPQWRHKRKDIILLFLSIDLYWTSPAKVCELSVVFRLGPCISPKARFWLGLSKWHLEKLAKSLSTLALLSLLMAVWVLEWSILWLHCDFQRCGFYLVKSSCFDVRKEKHNARQYLRRCCSSRSGDAWGVFWLTFVPDVW